jgi:hypothetical protein
MSVSSFRQFSQSNLQVGFLCVHVVVQYTLIANRTHFATSVFAFVPWILTVRSVTSSSRPPIPMNPYIHPTTRITPTRSIKHILVWVRTIHSMRADNSGTKCLQCCACNWNLRRGWGCGEGTLHCVAIATRAPDRRLWHADAVGECRLQTVRTISCLDRGAVWTGI